MHFDPTVNKQMTERSQRVVPASRTLKHTHTSLWLLGPAHVSAMSVPQLSLLVLVLALRALDATLALGCPAGCRCYSLTVECGSMGLREFPQNIPPITQVSASSTTSPTALKCYSQTKPHQAMMSPVALLAVHRTHPHCPLKTKSLFATCTRKGKLGCFYFANPTIVSLF